MRLPPLPSSLAPLGSNGALCPLCETAQDATPLVDALASTARRVRSPLFFPGHKMGGAAPERLVAALSRRPLRLDLPELPELDNLFAPEGVIQDAQHLAARAFSAERTWFLVNGSTVGVLAAVTAAVQIWRQRAGGRRRGERPLILVPRNAHKSVYSAMVVAGAEPLWLTPEYDETSGLCLGVASSSVAAGVAKGGARVAAVLVVSPTYEGVLSDVSAIGHLCRSANVPLIVDEAHGAHLQFLPEATPLPDPSTGGDGGTATALARFPRGALLEGADVVVQSTHKTLGSLTQSAMVHMGPGALSRFPPLAPAIGAALELLQSSSPSYLLLASLDAARWQMASPRANGRARLLRASHHAEWLRDRLQSLPDGCPRLAAFAHDRAGVHALDPLRVTLLASESTDGFELDESLIADGVYAELPQQHSLTLALSAGTTRNHVRRLVRSLRRLEHNGADAADAAHQTSLREAAIAVAQQTVATGEADAASPRDAYFRERRHVEADAAVGRIAAELICPYPPGIPTLVPGEPVTREALEELRRLRDAGCTITGGSDPQLHTIAVLEDQEGGSEAAADADAEEQASAALEAEYERTLGGLFDAGAAE